MVLKLPLAQKRIFWVFEKGNFQFFRNFWVKQEKPFSGKVRQSVQNYLNQNLIIGSFLENGLEGTLSSKTNVLSISKAYFSVFCKLLSDEVETVFWEIEAKRSKLFQSKIDHRKLLRTWFCCCLELKNECSELLKRAILNFLEIFEWQRRNRFLAKWGKAFKTIQIKIWSYEASWMVLKNGFETFWSLIPRLCVFKKGIFQYLQIFDWWRWNRFLGKQENVAKTFSRNSTLLRGF